MPNVPINTHIFYLLNLEELKSLRQKDFSKEELAKMVKESMTKEELLSLLLDK